MLTRAEKNSCVASSTITSPLPYRSWPREGEGDGEFTASCQVLLYSPHLVSSSPWVQSGCLSQTLLSSMQVVLLPQRNWPGLQKVEGVVAERKKAVFNRSLKRFATVVFLQLVGVQPSATILSLPPYHPMWGNPGQSWILDSTLWIPDYNYWIPVFVSRTWLLDSGFQLIVGFRIPKPRSPDSTSKIFRVPDSTSKFSHILDSTSKNFPDSAIHYMWRAAIGSLIL